MFKTAYNAMFQNIAPTETVCRQVLSAMQKEEEKQMPTILPVKKTKDHRQVWTLVACAAVVLVAVALTATLMRDEKPPMLPAGVTTTVTETTAIVTTTTTVENEIVPPPSTDTSMPTQSTTVAPTTKPPSEPDRSSTTTSTTASLTTPTAPISTTNPAEDYEELFQLVNRFIAEGPAKNETFPTTNINMSTANGNSPTTSSPWEEAPTPTASPTMPPTSPWTPKSGKTIYEEEYASLMVHTVQMTDKVIGHLQNNAVTLAPVDSNNTAVYSTTKLNTPPNTFLQGFHLYGDRMAVVYVPLGGSVSRKVTYIHLYDISDPTAPRLVQKLGQSGGFSGAQVIDGTLYIATYCILDKTPKSDDPSTFVPCLYQNEKANVLSPAQIHIADRANCNAYTVLTATALSGTDTRSAAALFGQSNSYIYISDSGFVVMSEPYIRKTETTEETPNAIRPNGSTKQSRYYATDTTLFACENGTIRILADVLLQGFSSDHVTFKEQNGHYYILLREIVSQTWQSGLLQDAESKEEGYNLFVLNETFDIVGQLSALWSDTGAGRIYFNETTLYNIIGKRVFSVDISTPATPRPLPERVLDFKPLTLYPIDQEHMLLIYEDTHYKVAIIDTDWTVLHELTSAHDLLPNIIQDGWLGYMNQVYVYGANGLYELPLPTKEWGFPYYLLTTDRTLYLASDDSIFVYDRTDNYRFIGELKK